MPLSYIPQYLRHDSPVYLESTLWGRYNHLGGRLLHPNKLAWMNLRSQYTRVHWKYPQSIWIANLNFLSAHGYINPILPTDLSECAIDAVLSGVSNRRRRGLTLTVTRLDKTAIPPLRKQWVSIRQTICRPITLSQSSSVSEYGLDLKCYVCRDSIHIK
ncbi:hypothetical protein CEXT_644911 [Caerostris extrusa]|uniref:Uncharacterized protein n=1 Tax=Caerostris extrusa TaxID=172846 RepID=A0AAV4XAM0_CAEEX|nr:hypothetical protein CEXT_644911 [Caerostris extrusa]